MRGRVRLMARIGRSFYRGSVWLKEKGEQLQNDFLIWIGKKALGICGYLPVK